MDILLAVTALALVFSLFGLIGLVSSLEGK